MKRSPKPADLNQRAFAIVREATGQSKPIQAKDPAAVERGHSGGLARAASLTPERRKEISKRVVAVRAKRPIAAKKGMA